jgi:hypothetical protein
MNRKGMDLNSESRSVQEKFAILAKRNRKNLKTKSVS